MEMPEPCLKKEMALLTQGAHRKGHSKWETWWIRNWKLMWIIWEVGGMGDKQGWEVRCVGISLWNNEDLFQKYKDCDVTGLALWKADSDAGMKDGIERSRRQSIRRQCKTETRNSVRKRWILEMRRRRVDRTWGLAGADKCVCKKNRFLDFWCGKSTEGSTVD